MDEDSMNHNNKQASSFYTYYKVLSQENYDLGRNVSKFVKDFIESNSNTQKAAEYIPHQVNFYFLMRE